MSRYRLDPEAGVIHDTRSGCEGALTARLPVILGGYLLFRKWLKAGSEPCKQCFGEDTVEASPRITVSALPYSDTCELCHDIVEST